MLESAFSLNASSLWTPITNGITTNAGVFSVSVNTTNTARFFRLHKP